MEVGEVVGWRGLAMPSFDCEMDALDCGEQVFCQSEVN